MTFCCCLFVSQTIPRVSIRHGPHPIYCSAITGRLLVKKFNIKPALVVGVSRENGCREDGDKIRERERGGGGGGRERREEKERCNCHWCQNLFAAMQCKKKKKKMPCVNVAAWGLNFRGLSHLK